jgi:hypothetical protein
MNVTVYVFMNDVMNVTVYVNLRMLRILIDVMNDDMNVTVYVNLRILRILRMKMFVDYVKDVEDVNKV